MRVGGVACCSGHRKEVREVFQGGTTKPSKNYAKKYIKNYDVSNVAFLVKFRQGFVSRKGSCEPSCTDLSFLRRLHSVVSAIPTASAKEWRPQCPVDLCCQHLRRPRFPSLDLPSLRKHRDSLRDEIFNVVSSGCGVLPASGHSESAASWSQEMSNVVSDG